jgi:hypothetical protein
MIEGGQALLYAADGAPRWLTVSLGLPDAASPILPVIVFPFAAAADRRQASGPIGRSGRRALLAIGGRGLLAAVIAVGAPPRSAQAHHGFAGKYDFSRPMYLAGRLVDSYVGYPHARLTIDVPKNLHLPRDREWMRALEDEEARPTTTLLRAGDRRGIVDVLLDWRMTRRLLDEPGALEPGQPVETVVYRRITDDEYRDELRAVLVTLPDGRVLVNSSPGVASR